ncbi:MAG: hypothetical protein RL885_32285 [Planctomycetota bacterium]
MARRKFGQTWWGRRWLSTLGQLGGRKWASRLQRGRAFAGAGRVGKLKIEQGRVTAQVKGKNGRAYYVTLRLRQLSRSQWKRIIDRLASQAIFAARLLAGEMPEDIDRAFADCGTSLFPRRMKEVEGTCSCADRISPCQHIAALHYALGDKVDEDPFLLFQLRGRPKERVLQALRGVRSHAAHDAMPEVELPPVAEEDRKTPARRRYTLDEFAHAEPWEDRLPFHMAGPEISMAPLKGLGEPPEWNYDQGVPELLEPIYRAASRLALEIALGERRERPAPPPLPIEAKPQEPSEEREKAEAEKESEPVQASPPTAPPAPKADGSKRSSLLGPAPSHPESNGAHVEAAEASASAVRDELADVILERAEGRKMVRMVDLTEWTGADEEELRPVIDVLIEKGKLSPRAKVNARSFSVHLDA